MMTRMPVVSYRTGILLLCAVSLLGCRDTGGSGSDVADGEAQAAPGVTASATEDSGTEAGRWEGEVTGGYQGNRISFVVTEDGARVEEMIFEGHWDCSDGIETTTTGPTGAFPIQNGRLEITSVDPPDGGATATRFDLSGEIATGRATGTLRANINALGCDTGQLAWSAAPAPE